MAKSTKGKKTKTKNSNNDKNVFPRIQRIIAGQLKKKPDAIKLNSVLQTDLEADSLDALEVIFQLEEEFDIKIAEDEAKKMVSVEDIVKYVTAKVKG